jgi:hypothetical protein
LRQKFPQANFQSVSEWVCAIRNEIASVLLPAAERFDGFTPMVGRDAAFFTPEVIKHELTLDERIDAMIDRAGKRLVQAKAMKQMLGTTSPNARTNRTKNSRRVISSMDQQKLSPKNKTAAGRITLKKQLERKKAICQVPERPVAAWLEKYG